MLKKSVFLVMRKNFYKTGFVNNKSDHDNFIDGYNNTIKVVNKYIENNIENKEIFVEIIQETKDKLQEIVEENGIL